ncbi:hypothetical protein AYI70_g3134 [Smittium culicis]|uniref:Uncharacterized protein n=1 Tax=Smittium culicis TaxID=133412 RepID=A0A1R1Y4U4_9FUNG|nr:hypothetical protein AYI70_g3134 [Smittium culicis]
MISKPAALFGGSFLTGGAVSAYFMYLRNKASTNTAPTDQHDMRYGEPIILAKEMEGQTSSMSGTSTTNNNMALVVYKGGGQPDNVAGPRKGTGGKESLQYGFPG